MAVDQAETGKHPYEQFEGTRQWSVLDRALDELTKNSDLEENARREYIVGFLCKALAAPEAEKETASTEAPEMTDVRATIARAQAMMHQADPEGGSMADELISERRREARGE